MRNIKGQRNCKTHLRAFIVAVFVFVLVYNRRKAGHIFSKALWYFPFTSTDVTGFDHSLRFEEKTVQPAGSIVRQNKRTSVEWYMNKTKTYANTHTNCFNREHLAGETSVFYLYTPLKVAYCEVPKSGCTFWKRIMRFLNKDFPDINISKPADINRHYTHIGPFNTTPRLKVNQGTSKNLMNASTIFMFARDPYSRVWSAYLDKVFLPDFWGKIGRQIVSSERTNAETMSTKCGYDVSFPEFIRYLVRHNRLNRHFNPIYAICDPCRTPFTFIGKQENFVEDARQIINETGMGAYLDNGIFTNTVENEIKSLSEDYLNLHKSWTNTECYNKTLICERLWKVFQLNGYIGFEIQFPANLSAFAVTKMLEKEFIAYSIKVYRDGRSSHIKWKKQKRQSLVAAYSALPKNLLLTFQEMYKIDFELFDYDKQPTDIYMAFANQTNR